MMLKDLTGTRYGRLTVTGLLGKKNNKYYWMCRCDCGNTTTVPSTNLVRAHTQSCGCLRKETSVSTNIKHGCGSRKTGEAPEYTTWSTMKDRCSNPHNKRYPYYGGRGITVDDRWINNFPQFLADMGPRPEGYSIDRIDNNKGYSPENCRWTDAKTQARNKSDSRFITHEGITLTLAEWSETTGISVATLFYRFKRGWTTEKALFTPTDTYKNRGKKCATTKQQP